MHIRMTAIEWRLLFLILTAGFLGGCHKAQSETRIIHVYAASSLTEAFTDLEAAFEATHKGVDVSITYAGSQVLRLQIEQGARPDVFASADLSHVKALQTTGHISDILAFAGNELVLVMPESNPAKIEQISDLVQAKRLVVANPNVPAGHYTEVVMKKIAELMGPSVADAIRSNVVSRENNVRLVRAKVAMGEADAAFVYRSDVQTTGLKVLALPQTLRVSAHYNMGRLTDCENPGGRDKWIDYVRSTAGQDVLTKHGFEGIQ